MQIKTYIEKNETIEWPKEFHIAIQSRFILNFFQCFFETPS